MSGDDVFPDRDMSHRDKIEFMLEREGWAIDAVSARDADGSTFPSYAFTIGFEERFGFPEVCVVGLSPVACRGLFDLVAGALAGGTDLPIAAPCIGLLDGGQPCAFLPVEVATCASLFPSLVEHHRLAGGDPEGFALVQLAWPDRAGALPWEPAFDRRLLTAQVLLGDAPGA
ncbi:MAG: DUF4262 domain-containing protein [Acidimicrobiales bacterium]